MGRQVCAVAGSALPHPSQAATSSTFRSELRVEVIRDDECGPNPLGHDDWTQAAPLTPLRPGLEALGRGYCFSGSYLAPCGTSVIFMV